MKRYDLVVIGSGPGGFSAAMRAIDFRKSVCLIEAGNIGGAGIINGALTSKTLWELSHDYAVTSSIDRGYRASGLQVDYAKVQKTVTRAAKTKQYQILSQIETFCKDNGNGFICLEKGFARFIDPHTIEITGEEGKKRVQGDYFVIATGSSPKDHPVIRVDQKRIVNSDGIHNLEKFPERLMIIGSGIIGCEFATIFSNFKNTEVHLIDRAHRVIPFEDDDVSHFVSRNLQKNGVIVHHNANLRNMRAHPDFLEVILDYEDGHSKVVEVDTILISIGRKPNTENLGLENAGITPLPSGHLNINEQCVLGDFKNCHIFAAGDITGNKALYCVAEEQGRYIVEAIWGESAYPLDYSNMPTLMFFRPELASVGKNEKMLQQSNIPYKAVYYSNELVSRTIAMQSTEGFVKIMVSDDEQQRILGMRAAGPQASAFIVSISYLLNQGATLKDVLRSIHPHPSVTEGIQECLRVFTNTSIYKPEAFPDLIKVTHWKPD